MLKSTNFQEITKVEVSELRCYPMNQLSTFAKELRIYIQIVSVMPYNVNKVQAPKIAHIIIIIIMASYVHLFSGNWRNYQNLPVLTLNRWNPGSIPLSVSKL